MFGMIPYRYRNEVSRPHAPWFPDDFFRPFFGEAFQEGFRVAVKDEGDHYLMEAELPGLSKDQIHIDVENGRLTISANWCREKRDAESFIVNERRCGSVRRSFNVSDVDDEKITAQYTDGMLKLTLPKLAEEQEKGKRIEIQ